ncbi:TetR/AcrR family transcriptional regulator [Pseudonocardia sp. K10HN5]|uniref:TetR/AcrR family transcriptional regulator n=1 Tax=Pseudonocardia acidicola TaxID=2724939 RepID=A0ABX1S9F3_9PSEU|nr:TetR/AcrR family transcriptional regulator [Pseudonocardia acidicola]
MAGRRDLLLEVAAELVARRGFAKTAVADVAEAAGVAKGSVYREFASKDDLLDALLRDRSLRLLARVRDAVEADPDGGRLSVLYRHALCAVLDEPLLCALYARDAGVLGTLVLGRGAGDSQEEWPREVLRTLDDAGLLRPGLDAGAVQHVLGALATGMIALARRPGAQQAARTEDTLRVLTDLVARGLEPEGPVDPDPGKRAVRALLDRFTERVAGRVPAGSR